MHENTLPSCCGVLGSSDTVVKSGFRIISSRVQSSPTVSRGLSAITEHGDALGPMQRKVLINLDSALTPADPGMGFQLGFTQFSGFSAKLMPNSIVECPVPFFLSMLLSSSNWSNTVMARCPDVPGVAGLVLSLGFLQKNSTLFMTASTFTI